MTPLSRYAGVEYILGGLFIVVLYEAGWGWGTAVAVVSIPIRLHVGWLTERAMRRRFVTAERDAEDGAS